MRNPLLLLAFLAAAPLARADFLNGSFEDPGIAPDYYSQRFAGELPGWAISDSTLVRNGYDGNGSGTTWHDTAAGSQYLYLNTSVGNESISQSVVLGAGSNVLRFMLADFASDFVTPGGAVEVSIVRDGDGLDIVSSQAFDTAAYSDFVAKSLTFVAPTTESYTFTFTGVPDHAGNLDDLHVGAVPEPASLAALGLGALAALRRKGARG